MRNAEFFHSALRPPNSALKLMPYDPSLPTNNSPIVAAELRNQFNGLNDLIADLPTTANVNDMIVSNTPRNCDGVAVLAGSIANPPTQAQVLALQDKVNELIAALHRT